MVASNEIVSAVVEDNDGDEFIALIECKLGLCDIYYRVSLKSFARDKSY